MLSKNQKAKKEKATKVKVASKKSSKRKKGRNASGSYSIKQKFNDGIPRIGVYTIPERKALLARFHAKRENACFQEDKIRMSKGTCKRSTTCPGSFRESDRSTTVP